VTVAEKPAAQPREHPRSRASALPAWAALCFFCSGAAGLLYEIVWSKELAYLLGSSLHAVAAVVASFLLGLALGARLLGVPLSRRGPVRARMRRWSWAWGSSGSRSCPRCARAIR
jgi:spermidine synthase